MLITEGRVLAVADGGQFVRVLSAETGEPIVQTSNGQEMPQTLSTGVSNWRVQVRVVGPRVYAISQKTVMGFSLDRPEDNWVGQIDSLVPPSILEAFIGRRHVVLLDLATAQPGAPPEDASRFRLLAYGRYPRKEGHTGESGKLDQTPYVTDQAGIDTSDWQAVDGGFYYRSTDREAHYLKGGDTGT